MKWHLFALGAVVALVVGVGAAERPVKKKPADAKSYDESKKEFPVGKTMTWTTYRDVQQTVTKTIQVGNQVQTVTETVTVKVPIQVEVVVPERKWTLGVEGWHDHEGFNVEKVAADSPLSKVRILTGNKESFRKVEANDVITHIDGKPVVSEQGLYLALQGTAAPERLSLDIISAKDGSMYSGTVAATKATK